MAVVGIGEPRQGPGLLERDLQHVAGRRAQDRALWLLGAGRAGSELRGVRGPGSTGGPGSPVGTGGCKGPFVGLKLGGGCQIWPQIAEVSWLLCTVPNWGVGFGMGRVGGSNPGCWVWDGAGGRPQLSQRWGLSWSWAGVEW